MAMLPIPTRSDNARQPQSPSPWVLGAQIGGGGFGAVFRCHDTSESVERRPSWAMKVCQNIGEVIGECFAESHRLKHANLLSIEEVLATPKNKVCVRMPCLEGLELFKCAGRLSDSGMLRTTRGLVAAVAYLHRRGLVHRDIKPENVFLTEGCSKAILVDLGALSPQGVRALTQGTQAYQPPEARGTRTQTVESSLDDWGVGATLATVAVGALVRSKRSCLKVMKKSARLSRLPTTRIILSRLIGLIERSLEDRLRVRSLSVELDELSC